MTSSSIFTGAAAMESMLAKLRIAHKPKVTIYTYLLGDIAPGTAADTLYELNRHSATVYVGTTRYSYKPALTQIKRHRKRYPKVTFELSMYDHRKVWLVESPFGSYAWVGSQNLCEPNTTNLMIQLTGQQVSDLKLHLNDTFSAEGLVSNAIRIKSS